MVTNIKVYLLSDYWAAGTAQLKISFRRLLQRGKGDLTKLGTFSSDDEHVNVNYRKLENEP